LKIKKKTQINKYCDFIIKYSNKKARWKRFHRWVPVNWVLSTIDYLLINKHTTEQTREMLLRLYMNIERLNKRMKANYMPLKVLKTMLKPLQIIDERIN